jgi:outer membrane receptor protein involved in Fe transport
LRKSAVQQERPRWTTLLTLIALLCPSIAWAQDNSETPQDPQPIVMDFELDERDVVEAAAKTRTTIQQAPAIITVITKKDIQNRGYRTINDVLRTIPGFEGDRWQYNGWTKESLTRGIPRTVLVLLDGVNIVDPLKNAAAIDRRIPLDMVKRIEVTSGPGSVLWGSNALLGVINIITHDSKSNPGVKIRTGGGDGSGARRTAKVHASYGDTFLDDWLSVHIGATYYTTEGPELMVGTQNVLGPLPQPAADGTTIMIPHSKTTKPYGRDHFINAMANVHAGPVSLHWSSSWDQEYRELSSGGEVLAGNYLSDPSSAVSADALVSKQKRYLHTVNLQYADRFANEQFGTSILAHFTSWGFNDDPLGVFPRSNILAQGATTKLSVDHVFRTGINLDFDHFLPHDHHLLYGAEISGDVSSPTMLTSFDPRMGPSATSSDCLDPFEWRPQLDSNRPCSVTEQALNSADRIIGALYLTDEWRMTNWLTTSLGARGQFSSTYAPTLLFSGGVVASVGGNVFLKTTYGEGFRPPDFQSTSVASGLLSGVTYQGNPNLDVERSRSVEVEVNMRVLENVGVIKRLYLRADYAYTRMNAVITNVGGRYENSGDRDIHSAEFLGNLRFRGDHELWLSYYFVDVVDSKIGRLRNIANHILNAGGQLSFFDERLVFASVLTLRGAMEDLNRAASLGNPVGSLIPVPGSTSVTPTGIVVTKVNPVALLRVGVGSRKLFGFLDVDAWVYNALNVQYSDPDLFFDDRIMTDTQPKPRLSFVLEASAQW